MFHTILAYKGGGNPSHNVCLWTSPLSFHICEMGLLGFTFLLGGGNLGRLICATVMVPLQYTVPAA